MTGSGPTQRNPPPAGRGGTLMIRHARHVLIAAATLLLPAAASAQVRPEGAPQPVPAAAVDPRIPPTARAVRISETINIDGQLDEAVWMTAPAITEFYQTVPDEGAPVTQPTEV